MGGAGSSPHTRGALRRGDGAERRRRIIPAYAGSTPCRPPAGSRSPDHPRIRGEHLADIDGRSQRSGSSPHTRGAPQTPGRGHILWGIIPAYAGSTAPSSPACRWRWDHPRIRGEHKSILTDRSMPVGSSPHTRGARAPAPASRRTSGIIPAYAGSTRSNTDRNHRRPDHPRIRGEHGHADG